MSGQYMCVFLSMDRLLATATNEPETLKCSCVCREFGPVHVVLQADDLK